MPYVIERNGTPLDTDDGAQFNGFSLKKLVKKVGGAIKKVGAVVGAGVVLPTAAVVKASTWGLSKTGIKPFVKLESKAASIWRGSDFDLMRTSAAIQAVAGAAVGGAILAAPAVGAAISSVSLPSASTLVTAGSAALKAAAGGKADAIPAAATTPVKTAQVVGTGPIPDSIGGIPLPVLLAGGVVLLLALRRR